MSSKVRDQVGKAAEAAVKQLRRVVGGGWSMQRPQTSVEGFLQAPSTKGWMYILKLTLLEDWQSEVENR